MSHRTGQAQSGLPHQLIDKVDQKRLEHERKCHVLFGFGNAEEQLVGDQLGMEVHCRHIAAGQ